MLFMIMLLNKRRMLNTLIKQKTSSKVLGNVDSVVGLPGETIAYNSKTRINQYLKQGYELVHDGFANANDKRFDSEKQTDQVFSVQLIEKVVTSHSR